MFNCFAPKLYIKSKLGLIHKHNFVPIKKESQGFVFEFMKCKDCGFEIGITKFQFDDFCPVDWMYCSLDKYKELKRSKDK